jgi:hypothetical protein
LTPQWADDVLTHHKDFCNYSARRRTD